MPVNTMLTARTDNGVEPDDRIRHMNDISARERFINGFKQRLDELNTEIEQLETRADEVRAESRKKLDAQRKEMQQRRAELEKKLKELRAASEAQFEKLQLEAEHAWKAFKHSVNYFRSHFK
jgi:septal ring factor EnvC (AmiA/AmiB activator)